ncbi:protein of unknown function (plasmid) [Cupriavidus taiwanensis]|nr:protein of unknown function [Cupriavidus taiwanensis]SPD54950.1 protein of unknown function [Cupriavidus taiwanensis]
MGPPRRVVSTMPQVTKPALQRATGPPVAPQMRRSAGMEFALRKDPIPQKAGAEFERRPLSPRPRHPLCRAAAGAVRLLCRAFGLGLFLARRFRPGLPVRAGLAS